MSPAETALRDAWIAELWPVCREVSREERAVEKVRQGLGRNALTWEDKGEAARCVNTSRPLDLPVRTTGREARGEHYAPGA